MKDDANFPSLRTLSVIFCYNLMKGIFSPVYLKETVCSYKVVARTLTKSVALILL